MVAVESGDPEGPIELPVTAAVEAVAGCVSRRRGDRRSAGETGERRLTVDTPLVGPGDDEFRSDEGADAGFVEEPGCDGFDVLEEACLVVLEFAVAADGLLRLTGGFRPDRGGPGVIAWVGAPQADLGDLGLGDGAAGIDAEPVATQQCGELVDDRRSGGLLIKSR